MPKIKTNRAAAKRFKKTGTGKLKRNKAYKSHILTYVQQGSTLKEEFIMPKIKTNRAAAKRFKKTGTGKLKRNKAYKSHILTKKSIKGGIYHAKN